MPELIAVVNYTDFFERSPPDDSMSFIRTYPTDAIMLVLCKTNATLFQEGGSSLDCQRKVFREIFKMLLPVKQQSVEVVFKLFSKKHPDSYPVYFNEQAITWLMSQCFTNFKQVDPEALINEQALQNDVFDSLLLANERYYANDSNYTATSYEAIWHLQLRQQQYVRRTLAMISVGAVKFLFFKNFILHHFSNGPTLIREFKENLGLVNYFQYSSVYMDILARVFAGLQSDGQIRWVVELSADNVKLIEAFAIRPGDFTNGNVLNIIHRDIIPKPIYFVQDQYATIIDFNFFGFLIDTAFTYNFYNHTSLSINKGANGFLAFKGMLGKEFYESFLFARLLKGIFPFSEIFEGKQLNELVDFAVCQEKKDLFLIEVKSASVDYRMLEAVDIDEFKKFIDKSFLQKKNKGVKGRGVFQLINCIATWSRKNIFPSSANINAPIGCRVYPIIVYTEKALDMGGVNGYCNDVFAKEIDLHRSSFKHIYPLTMINLDFFITHYDTIKNKPALLSTMIKNYHKRVSSGMKKFAKTNAPYDFLNAQISFMQYIEITQGGQFGKIGLLSEEMNLLQDDT